MDNGFVWGENKYEAVVEEHDVHFYEAVAAFDDPNGFEAFDPVEQENRWLWVGRTPGDRLLITIYSEQDLPIYRIITAFDAEGAWRNEYCQRS